MKGFDFTDTLHKVFHKNKSAQDKVIFLSEDGDVYEPTSMTYDEANQANVVKITLVE